MTGKFRFAMRRTHNVSARVVRVESQDSKQRYPCSSFFGKAWLPVPVPIFPLLEPARSTPPSAQRDTLVNHQHCRHRATLRSHSYGIFRLSQSSSIGSNMQYAFAIHYQRHRKPPHPPCTDLIETLTVRYSEWMRFSIENEVVQADFIMVAKNEIEIFEGFG